MERDRKGGPEDDLSLRDTAVWSHEIPDARLRFLGLQVSQEKYHDRQIPFSIGLFGALEGQNLCHIVSLTVWIMGPEQFLGIGVSFDRLIDGQSTLLLGGDYIKGIKQPFPTARQLDFSIDSRSGERITGVDVYSLLGFHGEYCGLLGFSVRTSTNFGYLELESIRRGLLIPEMYEGSHKLRPKRRIPA
jgi:hypothetical protein